MKKQKIFEFPIDAILDDGHRTALEAAIEQAAEIHETDLEYGWEEDDDSRLHVFIKPVEIEVRFREGLAELHAAVPLWARAAFTEKRRLQAQGLVTEILREARLISAQEDA